MCCLRSGSPCADVVARRSLCVSLSLSVSLSLCTAKSRRTGDRANFLGADVILGQLKDKSWPRRRVGLGVTGAPARGTPPCVAVCRALAGASPIVGVGVVVDVVAGAKLLCAESGEEVGVVTSGTMSPWYVSFGSIVLHCGYHCMCDGLRMTMVAA